MDLFLLNNEMMQHLRIATTPEPTIKTPQNTGNVSSSAFVFIRLMRVIGIEYIVHTLLLTIGPTSHIPFPYCQIYALTIFD